MNACQAQAHQDMFGILMNDSCKNGYYLEIGSNHPINGNNTYHMETDLDWRGVMVEVDEQFLDAYKQIRPLAIHVIADATTINYRKILDDNEFPCNMNYLQIDIEAKNRSTLSTLEVLNDTVMDKYKFGAVTFEHDIYNGDYFDTRNTSRKIFENRGYVRLFSDVCVWEHNRWNEFEDWYAHPDVVSPDKINQILQDPDNIEGIHSPECIEIVLRSIRRKRGYFVMDKNVFENK